VRSRCQRLLARLSYPCLSTAIRASGLQAVVVLRTYVDENSQIATYYSCAASGDARLLVSLTLRG
jgi:hypothetical protein